MKKSKQLQMILVLLLLMVSHMPGTLPLKAATLQQAGHDTRTPEPLATSESTASTYINETTFRAIRRFLERYQLRQHFIRFEAETDQVQEWQLEQSAGRFVAGPYLFVVDPQTGAILEFGLDTLESSETPPDFDVSVPYFEDTLQLIAREIVYEEARVNVIQSELGVNIKPAVSDENIYTYRWWGQESGEQPRRYIQVALTQSGQLVEFVNAGFYEEFASLKPVEEGGIYPSPLRRITSPDGEWTALFNTQVGHLVLVSAQGERVQPFPVGRIVSEVIWSRNSEFLLVVQSMWNTIPGEAPSAEEPDSIWRIRFDDQRLVEVEPLFKPAFPLIYGDKEYVGPTEITLHRWSPDERHLLFWFGPNFGRHDGHQPWILDVEGGKAYQVAQSALPNPAYQSWSPDGSALVMSAGGYRSAQTNKWLTIFDTLTAAATTVISSSEQIPGTVAWSPQGDRIAYAAVETALTGPEWNDWMSSENPAIAGRRIYLLDVATGEYERLNQVDAFQDAPLWQADGERLYYVQQKYGQQAYGQQEEKTISLAWFDFPTGESGIVAESTRPMPHAIGYYGQSEWRDLLAYVPDMPRFPLPELTEVYTDATLGFTLNYPAEWTLVEGWQGIAEWRVMPTLLPPDGAIDLGPFSARLHLAIEPLLDLEGDMESTLADILAQAGPGQTLDRDSQLTTYQQESLQIEGYPAVRLNTLGEFGEVNHLLLVLLDDAQGVVLRGEGDGRLFDAMVATLHFSP